MDLSAAPEQQPRDLVWFYLAIGTLTSALGCSIICCDVVWNKLFPKAQFSILEGTGFQSRAFSLSGGTLLAASLFKLLPQALGYIQSALEDDQKANVYLFVAFAVGLSLCWLLNALVHLVTAKSVVHCAHDIDHAPAQEQPNSHSYSSTDTAAAHQHTHYHSHSIDHEGTQTDPRGPMSRRSMANLMGFDENSHLLDQNSVLVHHHGVHQHYKLPDHGQFSMAPPPMLLSATTKILRCHEPGSCRGFLSLKRCSKDVHDSHCTCGEADNELGVYSDMRQTNCPEDEADPEFHHHHVTTESGQLYSIGIQTAIAITVHKFPEGFLLYATNKADSSLGFQVFTALALHNFTEAFSVASPLYVALRNRVLALIISIVLCGGSQPLGALAAKYVLKDKIVDLNSSLELGLMVAGVSGFMTTIGIQMIAMPAFMNGSKRVTVAWTTLGVLFVLFTNCISA